MKQNRKKLDEAERIAIWLDKWAMSENEKTGNSPVWLPLKMHIALILRIRRAISRASREAAAAWKELQTPEAGAK